ncbi:MAG: transcriptional regulator, LysR family [Clostridia bacterium]|jgi:DNA-binding transcriptional LysR family regulator|nr:transcriptional regulator, LysR family [Clostridia bacterium]
MEILQLKYFEVVAKYEHITRAAEELCISQPSLSKVIARLEKELGVMLFDRQGRNIHLNSYGKAFLKRVERIFLELEDGKKELAEMSGLEQGRISLAWTSLALLPKILQGFLKKYPEVSIRQIMASTLEMKHQLESGIIDLCISSPPMEGPGIICRPLYTHEFLLAVPRNHRLAERDSIDLSEVSTENFVSTKQGYGFRDITDEFCHRAGFAPNIVFEGDVAVSLISLVNAGLGVAFMPSPIVKDYAAELPKLLRINSPVCKRTIGLAYLEGHYLSKAAWQFCQYIIDYFEENKHI